MKRFRFNNPALLASALAGLVWMLAGLSTQAQVNYGIFGNTAYVTNSPSAAGTIVIASTYGGYPVTSIGDNAFVECASLTSVTIPNSVTNLGEVVFGDCVSLTSVTLGNSVTSIGYEAFGDCHSLTRVTIPGSVTNIGEFAFYNCFSLTNIAVATDNPAYSSFNGALFDKTQTTLIQFPTGLGGSYAIPNSATSLGDYAFYQCTNLTSVTIPNSVTTIGEFAFDGCTVLSSATIPNSVTNIGNYAFDGCASLTSATIPNSVTDIGDNVFASCASLTSVTIPNSVTNIGLYAFEVCTSLTLVTIPNSVTDIGEAAFRGCTSLTRVTIPNSVTNIGFEAFEACTSLTNLAVAVDNPAYSSVNGVLLDKTQATLIQFPGGLGGSYAMPDSVTSIAGDAFYECTSLTSITIPNSVTNIGDYAFASTSLTNVTIPNSVSSIGGFVFGHCTSLATVTIPNSVTNIGFYAFAYCSSLANFTLLGNAPALEVNAFFGVGSGATVYFYAGTSGWSSTYGGLPTVELFPPQIGSGSIRVQSGAFGFTITGTSGQTITVEASTNLVNWQPIWTNTLSGASIYFTDALWTNFPQRFYRITTQ